MSEPEKRAAPAGDEDDDAPLKKLKVRAPLRSVLWMTMINPARAVVAGRAGGGPGPGPGARPGTRPARRERGEAGARVFPAPSLPRQNSHASQEPSAGGAPAAAPAAAADSDSDSDSDSDDDVDISELRRRRAARG